MMILPQDCCVTGIEGIYNALRSESLDSPLSLNAQAVVHIDLSFFQCLKALQKQGMTVKLVKPSEAAQAFCRLYRITHLIEGQS